MKKKLKNKINNLKKFMCFTLNIKIDENDISHFYFINREQRKFFNG